MDKNKIVMIAVGAGIVGLLVGMVVSSFQQDGRGGYGHDMMRHGDDKWDKMDRRGEYGDTKEQSGMMGMDHSNMDHGMMMVSSEREFIMGMIPHHEEAIATAKQVIERGGSTSEIKTLAENIVKAQEAEVAQMKEWYKNWYGEEYIADGKYKPMMRPLESLSGAELDKVFLTDMVMHHQMAIMMAMSVDAHIEHEEMKALSTNIKTTQSAEIETMQNLLNSLN
ncbi:DUF305 domain-containing protein [Patescibacteria group bacterium]|nr:DUF305 domain-containing protein [Patescibacteria group bacterium]